MMQEMNDKPNYVKGYRAMVGMTQFEMAEALGVERRTYLRKEANPSTFTKAERLAFISIVTSKGVEIKDADFIFE